MEWTIYNESLVYYTFRNNALRRFKIQQQLNKIKQVADTTELEKWMHI